MQVASFVKMVFTILVVLVWFQQPTGPKCDCGSDPTQQAHPYSMVFDVFFPEPKVVGIAQEGGKRIIRISYWEFHRDTDAERVLESSDGGRTWLTDLSFREVGLRSPSNQDIVYDTERDLFTRSLDGGRHWVEPRFKIGGHTKEEFVKSLANATPGSLNCRIAAVHPRDPFTVYGGFIVRIQGEGVPRNIYVPGMYVSRDGGDTWSLFSEELLGTSASGVGALGISPSNPDVMVGVGQKGVVITHDGGKTWHAVGQQQLLQQAVSLKAWTQGQRIPEWAHLQVQQIVFQPENENVIFLVSNKGAYRSGDGSASWCLLDTGTARLFQVGRLVIDPYNSSRIYVGTDSKVLLSDDSGCHFGVLFDWARDAKKKE